MSIYYIKLLFFFKFKIFILILLFLGLFIVFLLRGVFVNVILKIDEGIENSIFGGIWGMLCFSGKKKIIIFLVLKKNKKLELKVILVLYLKMFIYVLENKVIVGEFILKDFS